jgi:RNA polymerase sigma-70 factor (ECF subfamily)
LGAAADRSRAVVERTVREEWGHVLATLVGYLRDLELAEDVLQDAVVAALRYWPSRGVPDQPRAWLLQTARRRAIDLFRRDARYREKLDQLGKLVESEERASRDEGDESMVDQRLSLIFTCCHPALEPRAQVALTLRTLGGLTTTEIARAFLAPETTMAQRLVRAKRKIKAANIPYRVPPPELWPERLASVLSVVYLIFNEGYAATSGGRLTRGDLCDEAIRLGRILVELAPEEPEVAGLLALMLLHDSRRGARTDADGRFVTLEEQDRTLWDREVIAGGDRILRGALARRKPGPYQIQAAISAVHAHATSHAQTDWREIVALYRRLYEMQPSWVVRLNEIVAFSFAESAEAALRALAQLERQQVLDRYQPFHAAKADLLRRSGQREAAAAAYRRAAELTENDAERRFLARRLAEVTAPATGE